MSYKEMSRRLAELEQEREAKEQARIRALSDAELDALCDEIDPLTTAVVDLMSDADLDRAIAGKLSDDEWQNYVRRVVRGTSA